MRTLLRKVSSGLYFQAPSKWTKRAEEALDFRSIDRALQFIERGNLQNVELAFAFRNAGEVVTVPLERIALEFSQTD